VAAPILSGANFVPVLGALKELNSATKKTLERRGVTGGQVFTGTSEDLTKILRDITDGKPGWICNTCRFDKKKASDWVIEGPTNINRHSVIAQGHYTGLQKPHETLPAVMDGRDPKLLMDIHSVSEVNRVDISALPGAATSETFKK
jgi:NADH-quinone oxidoreductase subunit G